MRRKHNTLTETKTLTENTIHSQKTQYTHRKHNTLTENTIHSQKTQYTHRKQNTLSYYGGPYTVCTEIAYRNFCIIPYLSANMIERG